MFMLDDCIKSANALLMTRENVARRTLTFKQAKRYALQAQVYEKATPFYQRDLGKRLMGCDFLESPGFWRFDDIPSAYL
jgi:hypothetical protein